MGPPRRHRGPRRRGSCRIIGGRWRGRRLPVPDGSEVRPTPDRVRETLFNWLAPVIGGARCLDLFAGSGALGLEALSRGAARVVSVEREAALAQQLRAIAAQWGAAELVVEVADALAYLAGPSERFDVAFLDPPYGRGLLDSAVEGLAHGDWLAPGARLYLEQASEERAPALPSGWTFLRSKRAGGVRYHLVTPG